MCTKFLLSCVLSLALSGCGAVVVSPSAPASSGQNKVQAVASDLSARPTVADLAQTVSSLKEVSGKFRITRSDPIHAFEEGKAYFRTVALPPTASGKKLELRSYYSLDFPTTLFVPALMFLDSSKRVLEKRPAPAFKIVNGLAEHIRVLEPIPANAAYVVIYTTPARVAERMVFKTYAMTGVVPTPSFDARDTGFGGFYEGILRLAITEE